MNMIVVMVKSLNLISQDQVGTSNVTVAVNVYYYVVDIISS